MRDGGVALEFEVQPGNAKAPPDGIARVSGGAGPEGERGEAEIGRWAR